MRYINTPVSVVGNGAFCDIDEDHTDFEAIIINDHDEQICLVPTDLKPESDKVATEIVAAINAHDVLLKACKDAYDAISVLQVDCLGEGIDGEMVWPIRDEVLSNIAKAIAKAERIS